MNTTKLLLTGLVMSFALGVCAPVVQAQGHPDKRQFRDARNPQFAPPVQSVPQQVRQQPPNAQNTQRGQMSEDERRQLHRDLDKANRELYAPRR